MYKTLEVNGQLVDIDFATDGRIMKYSGKRLLQLGVKYCGRCQCAKELKEFQSIKGSPRSYCIQCTRSAGRDSIKRRYHKTKNGIKIKRVKYRNYLSEMCGGACSICGYNKFVTALEFHHVQKPDFRIMDKVIYLIATKGETRYGYAKSMSDELAKCVMICANCHSAIHGKQISINADSMREKLILISPQNLVLIAEWCESGKHSMFLHDAWNK
jgi:hypothetical protein